jgi:hypothetical protein
MAYLALHLSIEASRGKGQGLCNAHGKYCSDTGFVEIALTDHGQDHPRRVGCCRSGGLLPSSGLLCGDTERVREYDSVDSWTALTCGAGAVGQGL